MIACRGFGTSMPGEPLMALVTLESDDGRVSRFEESEDWLAYQGINEGDEWPEDLDEADKDSEKAEMMSAWMDNYMDALEEMDVKRSWKREFDDAGQ